VMADLRLDPADEPRGLSSHGGVGGDSSPGGTTSPYISAIQVRTQPATNLSRNRSSLKSIRVVRREFRFLCALP
jgi:hypothetical protein